MYKRQQLYSSTETQFRVFVFGHNQLQFASLLIGLIVTTASSAPQSYVLWASIGGNDELLTVWLTNQFLKALNKGSLGLLVWLTSGMHYACLMDNSAMWCLHHPNKIFLPNSLLRWVIAPAGCIVCQNHEKLPHTPSPLLKNFPQVSTLGKGIPKILKKWSIISLKSDHINPFQQSFQQALPLFLSPLSSWMTSIIFPSHWMILGHPFHLSLNYQHTASSKVLPAFFSLST